MLKDFKQFALKGNVVDLAVGVIIGSAFGNIVSSLVSDIMMPLLGIVLGGVNLTNQSFQIGQAIIQYGAFIQTVIDFLIISLSIFFVIRVIQRLRNKEQQKKQTPSPSQEAILLTEIRDIMKNENKTEKPNKMKIHIK
ncbi:large-conductance mechanosensitive channel [Sutcliffiella cohnii]|uniref:Large-conductance mechanosensitive channel n=1 Tax=Sutcliffiella cohnii TaxID=33932 RepID=A0A223KM27_9BACI|nr:large-conductance mechanosensitive channel protein MscL [Sutcliffiella cohnii]AST90427.1 large-conductance mechanosensitive channel [Sutcliffiella cohnii]